MIGTALAVGSALAGLGSTLYNLWSNKRDYDYQKSLQQQVFEREDTAVQRRMQDLENSGLNPNLAAGSAAGAGSVVSRSNTNDIDPGSALDMLSAVNQIKNQKIEGEILTQQKEKAERENALEMLTTLHSLGFNVKPITTQDGKLSYAWDGEWRDGQLFTDFSAYKANRIFENIDYQNQYLQNSAALIQKQNNWFTTKMVSDMVFDSIDAGLGIIKPNFYKQMKGGRK